MSHARCACKLDLTCYASGPVRFCSVCGGLLPEKPTTKVRVGHAQLYERGTSGSPTTPKLRVSYRPDKGWSIATALGGFRWSQPTQNTGEFLSTLIAYMPSPIQHTPARRFALALMSEAIANAAGQEEAGALYDTRHYVGIPDVGSFTLEDA